jgi:UDP-N-acetylmuramoylalanine--D-glutamate ligase
MDLSKREVLIIGTKRSGQAAIELMLQQGARVRAMDEKEPGPEEKAFLAARGISLSRQSIRDLGAPDLIVLSPAVPFDSEVINEARLRGIPVIGEVELASHYLKGKIIGITGSNGKTTTTALTGHLLAEAGIKCEVGGNIGRAVTSLVGTSSETGWSVLELSSFQLESIYHFRANIACCLNVTPDHLDRHHTFEAYANAKARLFETQETGDNAVLNFDDATCRAFSLKTKAQVFWFSSTQRVPSGMWLDGNNLMLNEAHVLSRSDIRLRGLHNVENVMAAALTAWLAGAPPEGLGKAVTSFPGVEHRIEFVRNVNGVEYYNDSKATNVDATLKALDAFDGNIWVILGGKDKGSDYTLLAEPLKKRSKAVLLIGSAAGKIEADLKDSVPLVGCGTLPEATSYAQQHAAPGDVVLLAPACASFDQFDNFEHRGNVFKQLVAELI